MLSSFRNKSPFDILLRKKYPSYSKVNFCTRGATVSDVTVIGAGFAGLASIQRLRNEGFTINAIESGTGVGGTWFWNRYPGALCDIESMEYAYQFDPQLQQDWKWTQRYSPQADILSYANHVADRYDLRKHINFEQTVEKCTYSESNANWTIETNTGHKYISQMLILGTGCLSMPNKPKYDGIEQFKGYKYYTSQWPDNAVDFSDKKVAVIGTGSSGIQCIPEIAKTAKYLTVYQRSAQYVVPLNNRPLSDNEQQSIKDNYDEFREKARNTAFGANFLANEKLFDDMTKEEYENHLWYVWNHYGGISIIQSCMDQNRNENADAVLTQFMRDRIRDTVKDQKTAELLCPYIPYACKRPLCSNDYLETYNRDNVELVSISDIEPNGTPINSFSENGIITSDGIERECDVLVFATGFDALTGCIMNIDIKGIDESIQDCWKDTPKTYLGLQTVGFPNMFMITGPHSPSVLTNMLPSIEQHVNWVADLIVYMRDNNLKCVEPTNDAQKEWVQFNDELAQQTLFTSPTCNSWYNGSNIDGKKRHFLPNIMGFDKYVEKCNDVVNENYIGFDFDLKSRKMKTQ